MPGYPVGVRHGTSGPPSPSHILGQDKYGGSHGWIIWGVVPRLLGGDPGGSASLHNFQCGGGRSGASLDLVGCRRRGRSGR